MGYGWIALVVTQKEMKVRETFGRILHGKVKLHEEVVVETSRLLLDSKRRPDHHGAGRKRYGTWGDDQTYMEIMRDKIVNWLR